MQVTFSPRAKLVTLGGVKRLKIIKFQFISQFQRIFYQTVCVFSQIKDRKHIEHFFILSPGSRMPKGGTWGYWGSNLLAWKFAMAPHTSTVSSSFNL